MSSPGQTRGVNKTISGKGATVFPNRRSYVSCIMCTMMDIIETKLTRPGGAIRNNSQNVRDHR